MKELDKLPIFRLIHRDEADHHATLVCKRKGLRPKTKKYSEIYNKAFLEYITDAKESLYPSGELAPVSANPIQGPAFISSMENIRLRSKLYGKLSKQEYDKLTASKEWKYISKLSLLKYEYDELYQKHINRQSSSPSPLEIRKMKSIAKKMLLHLRKHNSLDQAKLFTKKIINQKSSAYKKKFASLVRNLIKEMF